MSIIKNNVVLNTNIIIFLFSAAIGKSSDAKLYYIAN